MPVPTLHRSGTNKLIRFIDELIVYVVEQANFISGTNFSEALKMELCRLDTCARKN